jgi:hypothetical protein
VVLSLFIRMGFFIKAMLLMLAQRNLYMGFHLIH